VTRSVHTLVTGREYIRALDARKSDRDCRTAFLERACSLLPPRSTVFDFGCGPGLDARAYASRGHRVYGFDVDAQMCAFGQDEQLGIEEPAVVMDGRHQSLGNVATHGFETALRVVNSRREHRAEDQVVRTRDELTFRRTCHR